MIAALCEIYGPPENLVLRELPDPAPGPGEVLVAPARVALNFFDTLIIENKYQLKPALPFSPGGEFCGRVLALGAGVEGFSVGQRVAGYCSYGAARSRLVAPASILTLVPDASERRSGRWPVHHLWHVDVWPAATGQSAAGRNARRARRLGRRRTGGGRDRRRHGRPCHRLRLLAGKTRLRATIWRA